MKILGSLFSTFIMIVLIAALILFGLPRLFGVRMFNVTSGSMKPEYQIGAVVYAFPASFDKIKTGDVISFMLNKDTVATHRVYQIDTANQSFITKGDANGQPDGKPVSYQNVIGVIRFSLPKIGCALEFMSTVKGRILTFTGLIALVLLTAIFSINTAAAKPNGKRRKKRKGNYKAAQPARKMPAPKWDTEFTANGVKPAMRKMTPPPGWGNGCITKVRESSL